jgi:enediyne biosynthesis protein E3
MRFPSPAPSSRALHALTPSVAGRRATLRGRLLRRLLGIAPVEATFARRGFAAADVEAREWLEGVGLTFLDGYNAALEWHADALPARLDAAEPAMRGFAYEGAAMSLALLDALTPWRRRRIVSFLHDAGGRHPYMVHVGVGWALARLRFPLRGVPRGMDPLLGWLVADGYGFHEGYFHPRRYVDAGARPPRVSGYALRVFDQGLGRSLWFVHGADPARIAYAISRFAAKRRGDLWSGAALACAYAGGPRRGDLSALVEVASTYRPALAQGAAFAAKARHRAGNPAAHTDLACRALCGVGADAAAAVTDAALDGLAPRGDLPAYEVWRLRIQQYFAAEDRA